MTNPNTVPLRATSELARPVFSDMYGKILNIAVATYREKDPRVRSQRHLLDREYFVPGVNFHDVAFSDTEQHWLPGDAAYVWLETQRPLTGKDMYGSSTIKWQDNKGTWYQVLIGPIGKGEYHAHIMHHPVYGKVDEYFNEYGEEARDILTRAEGILAALPDLVAPLRDDFPEM